MKNNLGKILKGSHSFQEENQSGFKHHILKIKDVWNGKNHDDYGVLRLFRLSIITSLLFFPSILINEIFKSRSYITRKIIVEFYVLLKTIFPLIILINGFYVYPIFCVINIYLLIETYLYLFSKIFLGQQHYKTSNLRTLLLMGFNFLESGFSFAVIYMTGNYLNISVNALEAIYFSFVTSATIGYGDIYPITSFGKIIVNFQIFSSVAFLVLFFNFFSARPNQSDAE